MPGKHNAGGCGCCGCAITCGMSLYGTVTGVVDNYACEDSSGGSSVIANGDAVDADFFNDTTWFWDPTWTTGTMPGASNTADAYGPVACEQMGWGYLHFGALGGSPMWYDIQYVVRFSVAVVSGKLRVTVLLNYERRHGLDPTHFTETTIVYEYSGLCPTGSYSEISRNTTSQLGPTCLDFSAADVDLVWV